MFIFKWIRRGIFFLILAGVALTAVAASGCGDYVPAGSPTIDITDAGSSGSDAGSSGSDAGSSGSDTGSVTSAFSIGSTTLTASGENFTFQSQDSTEYSVTSAFGAATVSVNPDIGDNLNSISGLITGESYAVGSTFSMKDCFDTVFYIRQNNRLQSIVVMTTYYNNGTPLLTISFANSEITFGILVDVSDIG